MSLSASAVRTEAAGDASDVRAGKYLTFRLGREEFGIGVLQVREIVGLQEITAVPHTPGHVKGVINLRGKVIPVVDLRAKFGFPPTEYDSSTCIVVVHLRNADREVTVGAIVDTVSEVIQIAPGEIEDAPDFGSGVRTDFILGMAKVKDSVKILLDIERALNASEMHDLAGVL